MGYLFPINPISRSKPDNEKLSPIEKVGDDERRFSQNRDQENDDYDQLEEKVNSLVNNKKFMDSLELADLDIQTKSKLIELAKGAAATFLKKELLSIAKSILSISSNPDLDDDNIDEDDLPLADQLSRLVMKIANSEKSKPQSVRNKVGNSNPLEDKNAGFLVHYCKDILNRKMNQPKSNHKLKKLNKKDLIEYLKK